MPGNFLSASEILALMSTGDESIDIDLTSLDLEEDDRDDSLADTIPVPPHSDMQVWHDDQVDPFEESRDWQDIFFDLGARRCPRHPSVKTSSDDGMFDCECHLCESEQDELERAWDFSPENERRPYCRPETYIINPTWMRGLVSCVPTEEDNIPF